MALDTQAKRASAIGVSAPWRSIVPVPDATIGQGDRQTIAYYCAAVLMTTGTVAGPYIVVAMRVYCPGMVENASRTNINVIAPGLQRERVAVPGLSAQEIAI